MTVLLRLDCNRFNLDQADLLVFMDWLRDLGVEPTHVLACAIEAPATDGLDDHYLLHLTELMRDEQGIVPDFATCSPKLTYRTIRLTDRSWPDVRAHGKEWVRR